MNPVYASLFIICILLLAVSLYFNLKYREVKGTVVIDRSDPTEPPFLFLELVGPVESFSKHRYVRFRVENRNYLDTKTVAYEQPAKPKANKVKFGRWY